MVEETKVEEVAEEGKDLIPEEYLDAEAKKELGIDQPEAPGETGDTPPEGTPVTEPAKEEPSIPSTEEGEKEPSGTEPKMVPLTALHEERTKRQERDKELEQAKAALLFKDQLLEKVYNANPVVEKDPVTEVTPVRDPEGLPTNAEVVAMIKEATGDGPPSSTDSTSQAQRDMVLFEKMAEGRHADYMATVNPFLDKYPELAKRGFDAYYRGEDPAEAIYQLAKGFGTLEPAPEAESKGELEPAPVVNDTENLAEVASNLSKLPATAGVKGDGPPPVGLTAEALSHMSQEEFDEEWGKLSVAEKRKFSMGGPQ